MDGETCARIALTGLDVDSCLRRADSATALAAAGDLIDTGPTGTNVGDLVIGLRLSGKTPRPGCRRRTRRTDGGAMRFLVIDDDPQYRTLLRHHVACRWPAATIVEYDPLTRGALAPEILAYGFDAVLLDHTWTGASGIDWLADLARRPGFAPIVFLSERAGDRFTRRALALGASAAFGKEKLQHTELMDALGVAAERVARLRAAEEGTEADPQTHRFSGARIPGTGISAGLRRVRSPSCIWQSARPVQSSS